MSAGLDSTCTIPLTLTDPLPESVLRYLRVQRADESGLAVVAQATDNKISDSNEVEILRFLVESFSYLLDGFGTPLETLEAQLAAGVYSPGGNAWAAAHVSLGEQRVLRLARTRAEELLSAVESGSSSAVARCTNCDKASAQLMLCGRCKAAAYCGRACQVAHFKDHKATCRAAASSSGSG